MSEAGYLTIGKVVSKLKATYPDLSVSKVRYLEDEGLLNPTRTAGGYRMYSEREVERLETILYLQKSKFLPLSVIKDELDGVIADNAVTATKAKSSSNTESGEEAQVSVKATASRLDPALRVDSQLEDDLHPLDRMPQVAGVPISLVRKLSDSGIIRLRKSPAGRDLVEGQDLRLIKVCAELGRYGIEPKNLRQYVSSANREVPMLSQALLSISRHQGETDEERDSRRTEALNRLLDLTGEVRQSLIKRDLGVSRKYSAK